MAILSCALDPNEWGEASRNSKYETTYRRTYKVTTDLAEDEATVLRSLPGLSLFSAHPSDAFAKLTDISVRGPRRHVADDGTKSRQLLWAATVTYGYLNPFEASESGDPAECPIEVSIEGVLEEQPADVDKDGNPVVNSAGDYYDPAVTKDFQRIKINISRFERSLSAAGLLLNYALHKNSAPFQGFPMHTVKMAVPRVVPYYSQYLALLRWQVQYVFEVNPDTWTKRVPDRGYRSYDPATKKLKVLLDEYGYQPQEPFFLDGAGKALPLPVNKNSIVVNAFDVYPEADFNDLGFPDDIMQTNIFA